jgi:hypothetical protein
MVNLTSDHDIENELNKIAVMYDFEHITKLLFGALYRIKEVNPFDYCYNALRTKLKVVEEDSDEFKLIVRYYNNSLCKTNQGYYYGQ